jgi:hypothetical protein
MYIYITIFAQAIQDLGRLRNKCYVHRDTQTEHGQTRVFFAFLASSRVRDALAGRFNVADGQLQKLIHSNAAICTRIKDVIYKMLLDRALFMNGKCFKEG